MEDRVDHKKIAKILGSKNNEDADYHDYHLKKIAKRDSKESSASKRPRNIGRNQASKK